MIKVRGGALASPLFCFMGSDMQIFSIIAAAAIMVAAWSGVATAASVTVIDGDTIEQDGTTYRINGIDAPEKGQECRRADGRFGVEEQL